MTTNDERLNEFSFNIGLKFNNSKLLEQVFIHRSFLNEHPKYYLDHNERLEFLGDAVLELIVTEYLYLNYQEPEGILTNWRSAIVKGEMLAKLASKINLEDYLKLSRGEQQNSGRARNLILANTFEALIGATYLDQGYEIAKKFVTKYLLVELKDIIEAGSYVDNKSKLQELIQDKEGFTPNYQVIEETGPDHSKEFNVGVFVNDKMLGKGVGSSKQRAEQEAAKQALEKIKL